MRNVARTTARSGWVSGEVASPPHAINNAHAAAIPVFLNSFMSLLCCRYGFQAKGRSWGAVPRADAMSVTLGASMGLDVSTPRIGCAVPYVRPERAWCGGGGVLCSAHRGSDQEVGV